MAKVSIIIPSFNTEKYIIKCLSSIKKQTFIDFEVIIIDDSYLDDTRNLIKKFILVDKRFNLIELENVKKYSIGEKRNIGIEKACGDYIIFVDADDFIVEELVEKAYKYAFENNTDMTLFNIKYVDENYNELKIAVVAKETKCVEYTNENITENFVKNWLGVVGTASSFNKIFKASAIKKFGVRYTSKILFAEDMLFCFQMMLKSKKIGFLNETLYNYLSNNNSVTKNNENFEGIVSDHCFVYAELIKTFEAEEIKNYKLIEPILFIILMTQAMVLLKRKTGNDFELIERLFNDYFEKDDVPKSFLYEEVSKSIDFFIKYNEQNKYDKEDYMGFLNTLIIRNGTIVNRLIGFKSKNL